MTKYYSNDNSTYAAYRVFETLKFLIKQPASVTEIAKHLETLDINNEKIYSKSVVYKYLSTLKFAGIILKHHKCKYEVEKLPFKIDFSKDDLVALSILNNLLKYTPEKKLSENIKNFFYQLKIRFSLDENEIIEEKREISNIEKPSKFQIEKLEYYEQLCNESQRLKITYRNVLNEKDTKICEPIEAKLVNNNIYLSAYCLKPNQFLELNIKQIEFIEVIPQKTTKRYSSGTTIFKIKGKLAKRYTLRNEKHSLGFDKDGNQTIANQKEPKENLYLRILRYGENCEILSPHCEVEIFKQIIEKALLNN